MIFLETDPKKIKLDYVIGGTERGFDFTLYGGITTYLSQQPRYADHEEVDEIIRKKYLNNRVQKQYIKKLAGKIIKSETGDDRARAAVNLVQKIPYDHAFLLENDCRYPYEVLWDERGVCEEKSLLLANILRELGFSTALINFEKHMAIGIKCREKYSFKNSGYCFVETNDPSIITDSQKDYEDSILESEPEIIKICGGRRFETVGTEYRDAITWNYLKKMFENSKKFNISHANKMKKLAWKYGLDIVHYEI